MSGRGALIVVEGLDRSGKSTQCRHLVDRLAQQGHKTKYLRFPDRDTTIGKMIDSYLRCEKNLDDHVVSLLFSANRWEKHVEMVEDLKKGISLIVDRYAFSGVAYSSAKQELDMEWCKGGDKSLLKPDVVLFFEVSQKVAQTRAEFGGEKYETTEFQLKVEDGFRKLYDSSYWKTIDADKSLEEVYLEAEKIVKETMEKVKKGEKIGKLWVEDEE